MARPLAFARRHFFVDPTTEHIDAGFLRLPDNAVLSSHGSAVVAMGERESSCNQLECPR
ncbi:MAG: hypothetical protein JWR21_1806 [Herminiimonas sp.]|nr:hypothetical protein [Herminiimonas sp.]